MKPFDLEKALSGEPVVTRDGRKVIELHLFNVPDLLNKDNNIIKYPYPLGVVIENNFQVILMNIDGKYRCDESDFDLFMAPKKVKRWIFIENNKDESNYAMHSDFHRYFCIGFRTLEELNNYLTDDIKCKGQVIEIEVDE